MVLQGFWSSVETATVAALPAGAWRVVVTHDALTAGTPTGDALVDELHLVGTVGAPAAPHSLAAVSATGRVSLAWPEVSGAYAYAIYRATPPEGPFVEVQRVAGMLHAAVDATSPMGAPTAWQVAAVGRDGTVGARSPSALATR